MLLNTYSIKYLHFINKHQLYLLVDCIWKMFPTGFVNNSHTSVWRYFEGGHIIRPIKYQIGSNLVIFKKCWSVNGEYFFQYPFDITTIKLMKYGKMPNICFVILTNKTKHLDSGS